MMNNRIIGIWVLLGTLSLSTLCLGADWPQFRGPNRDGKSSETGLLQQWPASGPALLWEVDGLGDGYSSAAIANGLVYTTGVIEGQGYVFAFKRYLNLSRRHNSYNTIY